MKHDTIYRLIEFIHRLEIDKYDTYLSPTFFRTLLCPSQCGACCPKNSLYHITEESKSKFKELYPKEYKRYEPRIVNGMDVLVDEQPDNKGKKCIYLNKDNGRCTIHDATPLLCALEPIKFRITKNILYIQKQLPGRSWSLTRVTGKKGGCCGFSEYSESQFDIDIKVLTELNEIADLINVKTILPQLIDMIKTLGPHATLKEKIPITSNMDNLSKWI